MIAISTAAPPNFNALTPLPFLGRAASIDPDRVALIHGGQRFAWRQTAERCRRPASALHRIFTGIVALYIAFTL
jgi:fatty-acyl-CoA synthase